MPQRTSVRSFYAEVGRLIDEVRSVIPEEEIELSELLNCTYGMTPVSVFLGPEKNKFVAAAQTVMVVPQPYHDDFHEAAMLSYSYGVVIVKPGDDFPYQPRIAQPGHLLACAGGDMDLEVEWPLLVGCIREVCEELRRGINAVDVLISGGSVHEARECFVEREEAVDARYVTTFMPFPEAYERTKKFYE